MKTLSFATFKDKVMGCWQGKNIGGTLGGPFEAQRRVIEDVSFYVQDLSKGPPMNDDLDLQLVWLAAVERYGANVNASILAEYWTSFIFPNWAEYGMGKANLRAGLEPPLSGSVSNPYRNSCGCFIRSEIWACLNPGRPERAARYAYEDAIVDHADDGAICEVFFAAMQSAAFVESDPLKLLDIALSYIPADCSLARAIAVARDCAARRAPVRECRKAIHDCVPGTFGLQVRTVQEANADPDAIQDGEPGFDAPENVAFAVAGLLYYPDDFEKALLFALSFGEDTDCTCASLGATLGILHGSSRLPEKWTKPLGNRITTGCIDRVLPAFQHWTDYEFAPDGGYTIECLDGKDLYAPNPDRYLKGINSNWFECAPTVADRLAMGPYAVLRDFPSFTIVVDALREPFIAAGEEREIRVSFYPRAFLRRQQWARITAYATPGVEIRGSASREVPINDPWRNRVDLTYVVNADAATASRIEILFDVTMPGRPSNGTAKIVLIKQ